MPGRGPVVAMGVLLAACGDGGAEPVGPVSEAQELRARALAAGLAPLPEEPVRPVDNPFSAARVTLGRSLFFDPVLSGPMDVACSTCHLPRFGFADGRQFPSGAGGVGLGPDRSDPGPWPLRLMPRNSPPVLNLGLYGRGGVAPSTNGTMFWSGAAFGIEDQVLAPIAQDNELRGLTYGKAEALDSVLARLRTIPGYRAGFGTAFPEVASAAAGDPERLVTAATLRLALAAYLRELVTPRAPLDAFLRGDDEALTPAERRGLDLFVGEAGCVACHRGPLLSDFDMHVLGAAQEGPGRDTTRFDDLGWGEHGGTPYSFRTPPLRQVAETPPYLHAGTAPTLLDVLRFKNRGESEHPRVPASALDTLAGPLGLDEPALRDLEAFLHALTDPTTPSTPAFQPPPAVPSGLEVPR